MHSRLVQNTAELCFTNSHTNSLPVIVDSQPSPNVNSSLIDNSFDE